MFAFYQEMREMEGEEEYQKICLLRNGRDTEKLSTNKDSHDLFLVEAWTHSPHYYPKNNPKEYFTNYPGNQLKNHPKNHPKNHLKQYPRKNLGRMPMLVMSPPGLRSRPKFS